MYIFFYSPFYKQRHRGLHICTPSRVKTHARMQSVETPTHTHMLWCLLMKFPLCFPPIILSFLWGQLGAVSSHIKVTRGQIQALTHVLTRDMARRAMSVLRVYILEFCCGGKPMWAQGEHANFTQKGGRKEGMLQCVTSRAGLLSMECLFVFIFFLQVFSTGLCIFQGLSAFGNIGTGNMLGGILLGSISRVSASHIPVLLTSHQTVMFKITAVLALVGHTNTNDLCSSFLTCSLRKHRTKAGHTLCVNETWFACPWKVD